MTHHNVITKQCMWKSINTLYGTFLMVIMKLTLTRSHVILILDVNQRGKENDRIS